MTDQRSPLELLQLLDQRGPESLRFATDPDAWLDEQGWADFDSSDLLDALELGWTSIDPSMAQRLTPPADITPGDDLSAVLADLLMLRPEPSLETLDPAPYDMASVDGDADQPDDIEFGSGLLDDPGHDELAGATLSELGADPPTDDIAFHHLDDSAVSGPAPEAILFAPESPHHVDDYDEASLGSFDAVEPE